jgi:hypothetical protein
VNNKHRLSEMNRKKRFAYDENISSNFSEDFVESLIYIFFEDD